MRGVELQGEIEEVGGFVRFVHAAADHFAGHLAAEGHRFHHPLDLRRFEQLAKQLLE